MFSFAFLSLALTGIGATWNLKWLAVLGQLITAGLLAAMFVLWR